MSEKLPTSMTGIDAYIETLMEKHKVVPVPTREEMEEIHDEYRDIQSRARDATDEERAQMLERIDELMAMVRSYKDYHHGEKH